MSRIVTGQKDLFGFRADNDTKAARRKDRSKTKPLLTPGSAVMTRLMDTSTEIARGPGDQNHIAFQHTVFCQTAMPYRNPGDVRRWERRNGRVFLQIEAGSALDPVLSEFVDLPLPFGAKARLILVHLNSEALRTGSATIEVEDSLTAFVKRLLNRNPSGPQVKAVKAQLAALSTALIRLGMTDGHRSVQVSTQIIEAFDLWAPTAANQRVLWPSTIQLGARYFVNLTRHAVPLDERAVAALSHSAMGLDVYSWLAQRQHRVPRDRSSSRGRPSISSSGWATTAYGNSEKNLC